MPRTRGIAGLALALLAFLALGAPLRATWSIIIVDGRTGEVCIACATCIGGHNLQSSVPVVVVGRGGGCAQSSLDTSGMTRIIIRDGLLMGSTPQEILDLLAMTDPQHQQRQYGIVDRMNPPVTFTGSGAGVAKGGVVGQTGDWFYAIQGNVLTGIEVVQAAEQALLSSTGDMGQRAMVAMEAARALGGDGRCSCAPSNPTGCGVPPPNFTKSAHVGFLVIARNGDVDGACNGNVGCAAGNYYLDINFKGTAGDVDPVFYLQDAYDDWRRLQLGRADQFHSRVLPGAQALMATGDSQTEVRLELHNIDGERLWSGGAQVVLEQVSGQPDATVASAVTDNGDGTYSFTLTAGTQAGEDEWQITIDDGIDAARPVQLWPNLSMRVDPLTDLHSGFDTVSAGAGAAVPFELYVPAEPGTSYWLLGTSSGTQPGVVFRGAPLPLNPSPFFRFTFTEANGPQLPGSVGQLDGQGRASVHFLAAPSDLAPFIGQRLDWSAVLFGDPYVATSNAGFDVLP